MDWLGSDWFIAGVFGVLLTASASSALVLFLLRPRWEKAVMTQLEAELQQKHSQELRGARDRASSLDSALRARNAELEQLRARADSAESELARRQEELGTYRNANLQFDRSYQAVKKRCEQLEQELTTVSGRFQGLRRHMLSIRRHTVFLDGCSRSGKSTFIQRIINPLIEERELTQLTATPHPILSAPIPLGLEATSEGMVLHVIRFYDIAGENAAGLNDVLMEYYDHRRSGADVGGESLGNAAGLVVWNAAEGTKVNLEHLNPARAQTVYNSRRVQEVLERIVVFLNQCDRLEQEPRVADSVEEVIGEQISVIRDQVFAKIPDGYKEKLQFIRGSALYGTGVQNCFGELIRALRLAQLFPDSATPGEILGDAIHPDLFQASVDNIGGSTGPIRRRVALNRSNGK